MNDWLQIYNAAPGVTEVLLFGQIGETWDGSGKTHKALYEEWQKIPPGNAIRLRINSRGGAVWDGLPMYNLIAADRPRVTVHIESICASIASIIAMAGSKVVMAGNAEFMMHEPWTETMGDAGVHRDQADRLEFLGVEFAKIYARKTGKQAGEMRALMRANGKGTSFFGEQAKQAGFVDVVIEESAVNNLSRPANAGVNSAVNQNRPAETGRQEEGCMNKTKILALLAQHGKTVPDDSGDEILLAALDDLVKAGKVQQAASDALTGPKLASSTTQAAAPTNLQADIDSLRAEVRAERERAKTERALRISNELFAICAEHVVEAADWKDRVVGDEGILAVLRKMPLRSGRVAPGSVVNMGNPLVEQFNSFKPGQARRDFMLANHSELQSCMSQAYSRGPQGANTFSATLVPAYVADGLIIVVHNKLAMLDSFTTKYTINRMAPRATVAVSKISAGPTVLTNATNFEVGDSTLGAVSVTVNQLTSPYHVTNDQLNQGFELAKLSDYAAMKLADAISDVVTALLVVGTTEANGFGATTAVGLATAFDSAELIPIAQLSANYSPRNLLLNSAHLLALIPMDRNSFSLREQGAFGFDSIVDQSRWTGAVTNCCGFVCQPQAIAVASGLPLERPAQYYEGMTTTQTKNGVTIETSFHYNTANREWWGAHDLMFGAQVGNGAAAGSGRILVTS